MNVLFCVRRFSCMDASLNIRPFARAGKAKGKGRLRQMECLTYLNTATYRFVVLTFWVYCTLKLLVLMYQSKNIKIRVFCVGLFGLQKVKFCQ